MNPPFSNNPNVKVNEHTVEEPNAQAQSQPEAQKFSVALVKEQAIQFKAGIEQLHEAYPKYGFEFGIDFMKRTLAKIEKLEHNIQKQAKPLVKLDNHLNVDPVSQESGVPPAK